MPLSQAPIQSPLTNQNGLPNQVWTQFLQNLLNITNGGDAIFNTIQFTGGEDSAGTMSWNTDEETVDLIQNGATLQIGQEVHFHVKNQTGSDIADGVPVMATGAVGASGRITVAPMDGTDSSNARYFLGITTESIPNGEDGKVTFFGKVRGIDTSSYSEGDVLWISASSAGQLTKTEPSIGDIGMPIAFVINSHAQNGTIFVRAIPVDEHALHRLPSYTVSTLPSASVAGVMIYVTNETGGAIPAFSDGTNWRRVTDRAIVS